MVGNSLGEDYFRFLSNSSAKLARRLGEFEGSADDFAAIAAGKIINQAREILITNLEAAIASTEEFQDERLSANLLRVFSNPGMIRFTKNDVFIDAKRIAGDSGDFKQGLDAAKISLGIGHFLTGKDALDFWRERIYKPAKKENIGRMTRRFRKKNFDYKEYAIIRYERTITARLIAWEDLAPYWIILEFGTHAAFGGVAYPRSGPRRFVARSRIMIKELYQQALFQVIEEFIGILNEEVLLFLSNPTIYQPGEILGTFIKDSEKYKFLVTPRGFLGIRKIE